MAGIVAVVPARAQSKRIPGKNMRPLGGRPLVRWTLDAALASPSIERIIVSSDMPEMGELLSSYRAERLKLRPRSEALQGDLVTTEQVLLDAVEGLEPEAVLTLLPTSPFRTPKTIEGCIALFREKNADSVVTVARHKLKIGDLEDSGRFTLQPRYTPSEMHKVPLTVCENPAIHLTRTSVLRTKKYTLGENNYGYELGKVEAMDINDPFDWAMAEAAVEKGLV